MDNRGKAYLVGAGPGDPGLITLKAVEILKEADCVIYDFLANPKLLEHASPDAEKICVGKKGGTKTISQDEINDLLVKKARRMMVVRLKGGDPFIFGRGSEEVQRLAQEGIPFEVVPGVTSASAVPTYAGIPLTHRELASSVSFVTGQEAPGKEDSDIAWDRLSHGDGTIVFLMGWKNLPQITAKLIDMGRPSATPAAVISRGTFTGQRTVVATLDSIADEVERQGIKPPAVVVVGDVVRLRDKLSWFETKPLFGKRIVVTRALEQAGSFAKILEAKAALPIVFPLIKTVLPSDTRSLDRAIKRLSIYDWAIFTSVNGVRYFVERLEKLEKDIRELKGVRICAIGSMTAKAVEDLGIRVDLVPKEYRAEAIIEALGRRGI
ncbi:MAG: uroporphyrinogen-III C-methyltransferase, partial [Deltaproteobacteria bacterium]|nr:uroporphyrinogen-III C-methyltransferase [Deltaproteobacteria bacterium]